MYNMESRKTVLFTEKKWRSIHREQSGGNSGENEDRIN